MNDLHYEVQIKWSAEDGCFIAFAPELPGCMAHGDSYDEALNSIKTSIKLWIQAAGTGTIPVTGRV